MALDFSDFIGAMSDDEFQEIPVTVEEFVYSKDYLGFPKLSDNQMQIVKIGSEILKKDTLKKLYGDNYVPYNKKELVLALGKGCHAPYTPVYNYETGKWQRLDSFRNFDNSVVGVHDGETKLVSQYATESFKEGFGEMVRVTTQLGFVEDVYIGHKYYSWNKKDFYKRNTNKKHNMQSYQRIDELNVGDRIAVAIDFDSTNPVQQDTNELTLVGYWIGDGCMPKYKSEKHYSGYYINVDFGVHEVDSLAEYIQCCDNLGAEYTITKHKTKNMFYVKHYALNSKNKILSNILDKYDLWGKRAHDKVIPDLIWNLPNDQIALFIARLWQTDGCIYMKHCQNYIMPVAEYCTISKELAVGLQKLLLKIGVPSSIRNRIPTYIYEDEKKQGQTAYYLTISSQQSFNIFHEKIGSIMFDNKLNKSFKGFRELSDGDYNRIDGNIYWDCIKSIEKIDDGEYWTMTAAETHSYIGNGVVSAQSGKDALSTIICCYIVYQLLCLKDPAKYYGKPSGDFIDIVNVAINAKQANNVFFASLKTRIKLCPWFTNKFNPRASDIEFIKGVRVHSLNSEGEGTEGLNIMVAVLDEIDGFDEGKETNNAEKMYKTLNGTVASRFANGKVLLLSFTRSDDGFMMKRYNEIIAEKVVKKKEHTFKLNSDIPDGVHSNEFSIVWDEDHIVSYKFDNVWGMRRATWEVNPTKTIEDFKMEFYKNPADALGRFACCPADYTDSGWFPDKAKIDATFSQENGIDEDGSIILEPDDTKEYYIHVDLALKQDNCALAMAHVDGFKRVKLGSSLSDPSPYVIVDLIKYWKPGVNRPLDFSDVREFIISLRRKGFNIKKVTFDRWNSDQVISYLNDVAIKADKLSVGRDHYNELALLMGENRIIGPNVPLLKKELKTLIINDKGKVDHPGRTGNDLSDATAGAAYNAINNAKSNNDTTIDIITFKDIKEDRYKTQREIQEEKNKNKMISAPKQIPDNIQDFLEYIKILGK